MIHVLAGVNGAGKSSIGGSAIRQAGRDWYNPDDFARQLQRQCPDMPLDEINGRVWREGLNRLRRAILEDTDFAFETTLGGTTMTRTLLEATAAGVSVNVWYCGLASADLHIERVAARVARGGHDIPADLIRKRYAASVTNLCLLVRGLRQIGVYDNSRPLDSEGRPAIRRLLHARDGRVLELDRDMPVWAKPIAAACLTAWNFVPGW